VLRLLHPGFAALLAALAPAAPAAAPVRIDEPGRCASSSPSGVVSVRVASKPSSLEQVTRFAILVGVFGAALVLVALWLMRRTRRVD
jgi:beta-lactamase regulating signal transducer with metallopeptidase domain